MMSKQLRVIQPEHSYTKKIYVQVGYRVVAEIYRDGKEIAWEWFSGWCLTTPASMKRKLKAADKWADKYIDAVSGREVGL